MLLFRKNKNAAKKNTINKSSIIELIKAENIDNKKSSFLTCSKFQSNEHELFVSPEVIILYNHLGKMVFNEFIKYSDYKEKGAKAIKSILDYPYYILTCSWISAGCHFGIWEYFDDVDKLSKQIDIQNMEDNFDNFKSELLKAVRDKIL